MQDEGEARHHAAEALRKYQTEGASDIAKFGRTHRMTQRFCDYRFQGDSVDDVPLRPMLNEQLVKSHLLKSELFSQVDLDSDCCLI